MEYYIIRWNKPVKQPNGSVCYMQARSGSKKEVQEYAERIAAENKAKVEEIT